MDLTGTKDHRASGRVRYCYGQPFNTQFAAPSTPYAIGAQLRQEALFCIGSESILCSFRGNPELLSALSADYIDQ